MAAFPGSGSTSSTSCSAPSDPFASDAPLTRQRLYGRKRGRPLRAGQQHLVEVLLPRLAIDLAASAEIDPALLFAGPPRSIWLEIGFGAGEHLAAQAEAERGIGFIGCEVFENGIAKLLGEIDHRQLDNVRLFTDDARLLIAALPPMSVGRVFILFPDPWPKARHAKRRLIQPPFVEEAARVMKPGGALRFASDWADYADQALATFRKSAHFSWLAERADDWRRPPADHRTHAGRGA